MKPSQPVLQEQQKERVKIEISQEQQADFFESLIHKIKEYFSVIFRKDKPLHGEELQEYLLNQVQSDEEREALQKQFEEIDAFHEKQKESGKVTDEWYEEQLKKSVMKIPDAKPEDVDKVKEAVAEQIDSDIEHTMNALEWQKETISQNEEKENSL